MEQDARIYIAGHRGLVGSALQRRLAAAGYRHIITRTHDALDLCDQAATDAFFAAERPEYVFLAAALVGGIQANLARPADFIATNLLIQSSVIGAARRYGVQRLMFFGSTCAYPRDAAQPMRETALLTGPLELTSEPYAIAKIAGMKLCEASNRQYGTDYLSVVPCTLYGPGDNFDPAASHVLSALVRRFHEAATDLARLPGDPVVLWGSGSPLREFLYVDDLADACIALMNMEQARLRALAGWPELRLNAGRGQEISIRDLASLVQAVTGYQGEVLFDTSKPDGAPRKLLDSHTLRQTGWQPQVTLPDGLQRTYEWYRSTLAVRVAP